MEIEFKTGMRETESKCRKEVERTYGHFSLNREEHDLEILNQDLFSEEAWVLFGLKRHELVGAGMAGGAAVGAGIDLAAGGASFFLGAALGAVAGGTLAWFSAQQVADIKIINRPLGGKMLRCGPVKNPNLPFVVLGRARFHHIQVAGRTHARRDALAVPSRKNQKTSPVFPLADHHKKTLSILFKKVGSNSKRVPPELQGELCQVVEDILCSDVGFDRP